MLPVQEGAVAQSDRRSMPAATHTSDENAVPDPSVSVHLGWSHEQVQSSALHPAVAQTVSGLDTEYPVSQAKVEHVSWSFHTSHPYSAVVSNPLFLHMEVEAAQSVADESYHAHPPCLVPPDVR